MMIAQSAARDVDDIILPFNVNLLITRRVLYSCD